MSGANIMCRGLTSPGATIHEEVITAALQISMSYKEQLVLLPCGLQAEPSQYDDGYLCTVHSLPAKCFVQI